MNRVHDAGRNALSVEHVNDIMTNILLGPEMKDFDPKVILEMWLKGPKGDKSKRGRNLAGKLQDCMEAVESGTIFPALARAGLN